MSAGALTHTYNHTERERERERSRAGACLGVELGAVSLEEARKSRVHAGHHRPNSPEIDDGNYYKLTGITANFAAF